ncbi:MAG TPA: hypothetical protein VMT69_17905 [Kineosporiaceae bacterium]|nr:hypothetical protein [Kineosporiaceae bacterium]
MTIPRDRPALHNSSVDESLALRGACGQTHLPTGRTCVLQYGHRGSCEFVPRDRAEVVFEERVRTTTDGHRS